MYLEIIVFNTNIEDLKKIIRAYPFATETYTGTTTKILIKGSELNITDVDLRTLFEICDYFILVYVDSTVFIKRFRNDELVVEKATYINYLSDFSVNWELQENLNARHALNKLIGVQL